jgi:hypothetical protein
MTAANRRTRVVLESIFLVAFFAFLFLLSFRPNWDIDIFWHVKTGEWIADHLALPHTDIYSATDQSRPWTPFQWLYEVLVYGVNAYLGFTWIRLLHAAVFMASFALLYRWFRGIGLGRVVAAFLLVATLTLAQDRLRVRPEVFNFLFGALTLPVLASTAARPARWRDVAAVAVIAAIWANVHAGGALFLPAAAAAVAFGRLLRFLADPRDAAVRARLGSGVALLAAGTLPMLPMPGFVQGSVTAVSMLEESAILIPEWHPPIAYFEKAIAGKLTAHTVVLGSFPYLLLLAVGALVVVAMLRTGWREYARRRDPGLVALALFHAIAAAQSARFIYMDALALAVLAIAYRDRIEGIAKSIGSRMAILVVGALALGVTYESTIIHQRRGLERAIDMLEHDIEPGLFPEAASDAIAAMGLEGRMFHLASWGGYLLYRHFPDCTVFADGRGNFTGEERRALIDTHRPYDRDETLEAAWQRFRFDIVVLPPPVFPLYTWDRDRWVLVYRDDLAEVLVRRTPENRTNVGRAIAWWRVMGIDAGDDPVAFQDEYLRVLGWRYLDRPDVERRLAEAASRLRSEAPSEKMAGHFDGAMILFAAGRYADAERQLRRILKTGARHSTAALYLAWCRFLMGDIDGTAETLRAHFVEPDASGRRDFGPLRFGGKRILSLLAARVGLTVPPSP